MKQLISWKEETKKITVIGSFPDNEAAARIREYISGQIFVTFDEKKLTAEITSPDGNCEYLQVVDAPTADTIGVDTCLGRLEASVNNGPGEVGIDICLIAENEDTDILDVARVSMWTDKADRTSRMENDNDIRIMSFYDPYSEDYPDDGLKILRGFEIMDALEYDPDPTDCGSGQNAGGWKNADLVAYTDGSYNKMSGHFGAGVVLFRKGCESSPAFYSERGKAPEGENGWQVNGEIKAAEIAIKEALMAGAKSVEIHYDYEGVEKWATKTWSRNKSYTKAYAEFVERAGKDLAISFVHVKGHSGNKWNDKADSLAREACGA